MARSEADICNMGLSRIGIKQYIDDLANDHTEEAETANVFYADMRDLLLASFPWPFATLRGQLTASATEAQRLGWAFVYPLPGDCLQPRFLWPVGIARGVTATMQDLYPPNALTFGPGNPRAPRSDQRVPFAIEKASADDSRVLLCDVDSPTLFYTAKFTDPNRMDPGFVNALAWLLAAEMAMPLVIDPKKEALARQRFELAFGRAAASALRGQQQDESPVPEMIAVRG